jgi:hypothetical protein
MDTQELFNFGVNLMKAQAEHLTFTIPKHQLPAFISSSGAVTFLGLGSQGQELVKPGAWVREHPTTGCIEIMEDK